MSTNFNSLDEYSSGVFNLTGLREPGYPKRLKLDDDQIGWDVAVEEYDERRPDFVHDDTVIAYGGGLAEPFEFDQVEREFSGLVDEMGRPLLPTGRTGIAGLGKLWNWGESQTVDAVVTRSTSSGSEILTIGKATSGFRPKLPGGFIQRFNESDSENATRAAVREVRTETGVIVPEEDLVMLGTILTKSRRTTDNAWITTTGFHLGLEGWLSVQPVKAGEDADTASWQPLTKDLIGRMSEHHAALVNASLELGSVALTSTKASA